MARLGFSIYPEHSTPKQDVAYIRMAGKYGFKRVFACLLSVGNRAKEEVIRDFRIRLDAAHEEGMEVMLDVSPAVFERLGISYDKRKCMRTESAWMRALTARRPAP